MSTDISATLNVISGGRNTSLFGVKSGQQTTEDLADYVQRIRAEKGLSQRAVELKSGGRISKGYIGQIENRDVLGHSVTPQKLQALAIGLAVSEDEVFAIARGKTLEPMSPQDFYSALEALGVEQFQAYGGVANLTTDDRQEIIAMIEAMIEQKLKRKQTAQKSQGAKRR